MTVSPKATLAALALLPALLLSPALANGMYDTQQQILLLISQKNYGAAISIAEQFEPDHPNHAARVAFVRGMVAKAKGKNGAAATEFRKVLADQPDLTPARQQLAHALYLSGDLDAARHHFDVLATNTNDPRLRSLYSAYTRKIEDQRPWRVSAYVTLAPSSNVNKGSGHDTATLFGNTGWEIPREQRAKSGIGIASGVYGGYDLRLSEQFEISAAVSGDGRFYKDHDDDSLRLFASVKPGFSTSDQSAKVSLGPFVAAGFSGYDKSTLEYGLDADVSARIAEGLFVSTSAAYSWFDHDANNDRDSTKISLQGRLTKSVDSSMSVFVSGSMLLENARVDDFDHTDWSASVGGSKEWGGGWMTGAELRYGERDYDGLLAGKAFAREDWFGEVSLNLANRNFSVMGLMPVLNYSYTHQISNDEWSEYDSHDIAVTLTKNF